MVLLKRTYNCEEWPKKTHPQPFNLSQYHELNMEEVIVIYCAISILICQPALPIPPNFQKSLGFSFFHKLDYISRRTFGKSKKKKEKLIKY